MNDSLSPPMIVPFRDIAWSWLDLIVGLTPLVVWRAATIWLYPLEFAAKWSSWFFAAEIVVGIWTLVFPLWRARRHGANFHGPGLRKAFLESLLAIPLWVGIVALIVLINLLWTLLIGPPESVAPTVQPGAKRGMLVVVLLFAAVYAPLSEEVFCRGMLYNGLRRRMRPLLAMVVQAVIFGAIHPYSATHSIWAGVLGFLLAIAYEWRRTLVTPIVIHSLQNTFAFVGAFVVASQAPMMGVAGEPQSHDGTIATVMPGSSAEAAGLQVGDVIVAIDGVRIDTFKDVVEIVRSRRVGDVIVVEVVLGGTNQRIEVELKSRLPE